MIAYSLLFLIWLCISIAGSIILFLTFRQWLRQAKEAKNKEKEIKTTAPDLAL